jgi:hypothetical protein
MDLLTDVLAWLESHQYELKVLAGIENTAKIRIGLCQFLDIFDKPLHRHLPSSITIG